MTAARKAGFDTLPSATGGIARLVTARLREAGISPNPLLTQVGLTLAQIDDSEIRVPVQSQIRLLELAAEALDDDLLGFHLARDCDLRQLGLVYYVLASSQTLGDALAKAARYSSIANEGVSLDLRDNHKATIGLRYVNVERRGDRQHIEFWLTIQLHLCRQLTSRRLVPDQVRVVHHGRKVPAEFRSYLGCGIEFGSRTDEVVFPGEIALMPVVGSDMYLNKLLTRYCDEALQHRRHKRAATLRLQVENAVAPLLPHGNARAPEIARRLGFSPRTLARRLAEEGVTFSQVLHELKLDLAKRYLQEGMPVSRVAWLLGYREISAFTHAFKRWTGQSPTQLRQRAQAGVVDIGDVRRRRRRQMPGRPGD